jgi:hypothetical protein
MNSGPGTETTAVLGDYQQEDQQLGCETVPADAIGAWLAKRPVALLNVVMARIAAMARAAVE